MKDILLNIRDGFASSTPLDLANLALGIVGVVLMVRRSLWAFPIGLLAVSVQGVLFFENRFYADATVQVFFFAALAYGWWHWVRDKGAAPELPVTRQRWRGRALTLALAGAATVCGALALARWTPAVMPWRDAFIAAFSVAAQALQARKRIENWPLWTVVNLVAIASYWQATMAFTAFLYGIYLVLGLLGWREWWRAMKGATPTRG